LNNLENTEQDGDVGFSETENSCEPSYQILARLGEMHLEGGFQLDKDPSEAADFYTQAAEKAMQHGKGRIANKYYMLAEEATIN
jgi:elongation factor 2 kinase